MSKRVEQLFFLGLFRQPHLARLFLRTSSLGFIVLAILIFLLPSISLHHHREGGGRGETEKDLPLAFHYLNLTVLDHFFYLLS